MKVPPWRKYLTARFGELPDDLPLTLEAADEDLSPEESERRIRVMEAMADALEPFGQAIPDLTIREFALLGMAGVTAHQFGIICEARRAAYLTTAQWKTISEVFENHAVSQNVAQAPH